MKTLFILLISVALLLSAKAQQFTSVQVGIDGLTCSMCSRATEMSLRKLDFVDSVKMDLTNTNGIITFKKGAEVSVEKIAKAVRDAGFSVRYLKADFTLDSQSITSGNCFTYSGGQYKLVTSGTTTLSGPVNLTFIGKDFMPVKEFRKWSGKVKEPCGTDQKTYYVTT